MLKSTMLHVMHVAAPVLTGPAAGGSCADPDARCIRPVRQELKVDTVWVFGDQLNDQIGALATVRPVPRGFSFEGNHRMVRQVRAAERLSDRSAVQLRATAVLALLDEGRL